MSSELQVDYGVAGRTVYFLIRNMFGQIWNTAGNIFETYAAGSYTDYDVAATEQGASGFYAADMPTAVVAGIYSVVAKDRAGGSPAQSDLSVGAGNYEWTKLSLRPMMTDHLWRRLAGKKTTLTATQLKQYADDGSTLESTSAVSDDGTTQTQNAAT